MNIVLDLKQHILGKPSYLENHHLFIYKLAYSVFSSCGVGVILFLDQHNHFKLKFAAGPDTNNRAELYLYCFS